MKRYLCPNHSHLFRNTKRPVQLSTENCTACRWENRPMTLVDLAAALENVAGNLRFCHEQGEYYDPFGLTWVKTLEETIVAYAKMIHADYRKNFLDQLTKEFEPAKISSFHGYSDEAEAFSRNSFKYDSDGNLLSYQGGRYIKTTSELQNRYEMWRKTIEVTK